MARHRAAVERRKPSSKRHGRRSQGDTVGRSNPLPAAAACGRCSAAVTAALRACAACSHRRRPSSAWSSVLRLRVRDSVLRCLGVCQLHAVLGGVIAVGHHVRAELVAARVGHTRRASAGGRPRGRLKPRSSSRRLYSELFSDGVIRIMSHSRKCLR